MRASSKSTLLARIASDYSPYTDCKVLLGFKIVDKKDLSFVDRKKVTSSFTY